jgi:hypothetical protein
MQGSVTGGESAHRVLIECHGARDDSVVCFQIEKDKKSAKAAALAAKEEEEEEARRMELSKLATGQDE